MRGKLLNTMKVLEQSALTKPIYGYWRYNMDVMSHGNRGSPFDFEGFEYANGKKWRKKYDEKNPNGHKYRKVYWYVVGTGTLSSALLGYFDEIERVNDPASNLLAFVFSGVIGFGISYCHPLILPVLLPTFAVMYPLYKYSEYRTVLTNNEILSISLNKKIDRLKSTNQVLNEYTKYIDNEYNKPSTERNTLRYYDWCISRGYYRYKYGYYD